MEEESPLRARSRQGQAEMKGQSCQAVMPDFLSGELGSKDIKQGTKCKEKTITRDEMQGENNHNWRTQGRRKK